MYVPFSQLPDHSRIWIYQANRKLTNDEKIQAATALQVFCASWSAHQQALKTSYSIEHDQFIILATDEDYHQPSGCSIDSSVHALKHLQNDLGIDLFDRTMVAFFVNGDVVTLPLARLKGAFESGELGADTITFDNLVPSRGDLAHRWKTPVEKTWLVKYLPNSALASGKR
ncbi:MAG TPA: hypothetical protein VFE50_12975 [Cyclobacteriaceae bacterium]|nr:hypothetical protein [Cyclobacteriaceae bacterium]